MYDLFYPTQEWGCEGYHLWMVSDKPKDAPSISENQHSLPRLLQLQFVKAAVSVNPCVVSLSCLTGREIFQLPCSHEISTSVPQNVW